MPSLMTCFISLLLDGQPLMMYSFRSCKYMSICMDSYMFCIYIHMGISVVMLKPSTFCFMSSKFFSLCILCGSVLTACQLCTGQDLVYIVCNLCTAGL